MKFATYNIAGGAGWSGYKVTTDYKLITEDILESGAEVVGLQEVDMGTKRNGGKNTVGEIMAHSKWYGFFAKAVPMDGGDYGNAIISKYPIIKAEIIRLPFRTDKEEKRCVLRAVLDLGDECLDVFVTHTDQGSIFLQLGKIWELAKECKKFVLLGDFNYTDKEEGSAFDIFEGCDKANSFENKIVTTLDGYSFDNILAPSQMGVTNASVIETGHSDHLMLVADVEV